MANTPSPFQELAEGLTRYRDLLLIGPAALYVLGFLIVNLHLGSIGIVNFDLFRARYILVGALFLGFLLTLVAMIRGLVRRLVKSKSFRRSIPDAIGYSLTVYGIPLVIVMFLTSLSGESSPPAIWLVGISPDQSSLAWAIGDPSDTTQRAAIGLAFLMGVYLLGVVFFLIRPPKTPEGKRRTRREVGKGALIGLGIVIGLWAFLIFGGNWSAPSGNTETLTGITAPPPTCWGIPGYAAKV